MFLVDPNPLINSGTQLVVAARSFPESDRSKGPALGAIFHGAAVTLEALHHQAIHSRRQFTDSCYDMPPTTKARWRARMLTPQLEHMDRASCISSKGDNIE